MKFLLIKGGGGIRSGVIKEFNSQTIYPPLGLLYIAAALEKEGHKVEILDFYMEEISNEKLKSSVLSSDAVGFSVFMDNFRGVAHLSKMIKEIDSNIPLILGGPHCIITKNRTFRDIPNADISVLSDGEKSILEIIDFLKGQKQLSDIHGILYQENGQIKTGKPIKIIKNLDSISFPARHLVEKYDYGNFDWGYKYRKKFTSMITSRGCPFSCRFCARYGNAIKGYGFRQRTAENVIQELIEVDQNYNSIMIVDDNFLVDEKRANKIFDAVIDSGFDNDLLIMGARVDSSNTALYKKMKNAGVKLIGYGIESGNQDVLDFYNKRVTLHQISNAVSLAKKSGFNTFGTFIFGAPIETKKHFENTINFAKSLPLDVALFGVLYYAMGSPLWDDAVKKGMISSDEYIVVSNSDRNLGNFTLEELYAYTKKANRSFYLRPKFILNQFYHAVLNKDINLILNGMKFITGIKQLQAKK